MQIIKLTIPEYTVDKEPDYTAIGGIIDDAIKEHFMGQAILVRGISSRQHPGQTVAGLTDTIRETGTDRYDPKRTGDRYENTENKSIDLFAFATTVTPELEFAWQIIYGFYHSAIGVHGRPERIDIVTIYDARLMEEVAHQYKGRDDIKRDGFVFKEPHNKAAAVLAVIQIA